MKAIKMTTLSLFALLLFTGTQGKKTTCMVVTKEGNSNLTCFFSEDVNRNKKDFTVYRHYGDHTLRRVVDCLWNSGTLDCLTGERYSFNRIVTDHMTVEITRVSKTETGIYTCEISGSNPADRYSCELSTGTTTCEIQSVELMSSTTLTCLFPEDISQSEKDYSVYYIGESSTLLKCRWLSDGVKCQITSPTKYGYDHVVTNITEVHIHQVTKQDEGSYICEISGSTPEHYQSCQLTLLPRKKTTCVAVTKAGNSTLICFFSEDLSHTKKDFTIYHHYGDHMPRPVVDCLWNSGTLDCFTEERYTFNRIVTDHMTVEVTGVSKNETGIFTCEISGSNPEDHDSCELSRATTCEINPVKETENMGLTCNFPEDLSLSKKSFYVNHNNDTVVKCQWIDREWICTTKDGYEFMENVTTRATFQILKGTGTEAGRYSCHLSGFYSEAFEPCEFPHQGENRGTSNSSLTEGQVAGIAIGVFVSLAIGIGIGWRICRRRCSNCWSPSREGEQASENKKVEAEEEQRHRLGISNSRSNEDGQKENMTQGSKETLLGQSLDKPLHL